MSVTAEFKNQQLQRTCPELASKYAAYPLDRSEWLMLEGTGPDQAPAFVAGTTPDQRKEDYVFGNNGPSGTGYYHLLTRYAYTLLYQRVSSQAPSGAACPCSASEETKQAVDAWDTTKTICWNRNIASRPNDALAAQEAIKIAQQIANKTYNRTQNEQLIVGAILIAT
uniref:Uncharacterized protein n=1 Tax=Entomoneis paludosa TaxID=265537 RepID=A0A7S3DTF4_9STRA|mmetsp:Transcript_35145/g.73196  ORF Transcript_35145/g.73196 Transcript_35145/m.73196 type:complete len:168 (+) Transcript_35145:197-700(+)|eukprot:CAMPEP_0172452774 /NCGR_PEP_ID=MMETSP1065-20121228/10334_1 /TAXON_ID=265537 /ORGANISM="Amphiprora paludosa, Strain CCMP125" /LENGTH=167 /DNA_ID=CAMNT_0013204887 /DNA_START=128 /DNA_END=631 /DNA_ORIENTATION=-